jgi:hypothetical protein
VITFKIGTLSTTFLIILIIFFIFTTFGCAKKTQSPGEFSAQSNDIPVIPTDRQVNGIVMNNSAGGATPVKQASGNQGTTFQLQNVKPEILAKSNSISNQYNSQFLPIKPYSRLSPLDFTIGEMLDYDSLGKNERSILTTLTDFMDSVKKGEINKETIEESEYIKIFRLVSPSIAEGAVPVDYRIGKIKFAGEDDASAPLRVYGAKGSVFGSIYLLKKDTTWRISDVQIDFSAYAQPDQGEKFMPSAYNNWIY